MYNLTVTKQWTMIIQQYRQVVDAYYDEFDCQNTVHVDGGYHQVRYLIVGIGMKKMATKFFAFKNTP